MGSPPPRKLVRTGGAGTPRSWPVLALSVALSWLLPVALDSVRWDVLLIPVLVLAVGSLLRVGGGLLDRLVVAALLVCGAVMAFGLLFSLWPWGLAPVPIAGLMLTVVSVTGWLARRRPQLPLRLRASDLLVLGTAVGVWQYLHHPLLGKSPSERLAYIVTSEDRLGHFSYFDAIHRVGGYAFLHQEAARTYMMSPAEAVYPQGSHFLLVWLDVFVRSSTDAGPAIGELNRYFLYVLAAYALFCAALVWAARWIGGPRLRGWRAAAVCSTVAAIMLSSTVTQLIDHGFDSEIIGLLFLAPALALVIRPAMGTTEFALVSVAGLIAVSYVYNLYGIFVGIALLGTCVVHRRRFAARRWPLYAALTGGLLVAAVPSVVSVLTEFDVAKTSNLAGPMVGADRTVFLGCGLLALVAALVPVNRRTGTGGSLLVTLLGGAVVVGAFGWWQNHTIGYYSYYFEKVATAGFVIALISLGMVGLLLHPVGRGKGSVLRHRVEELAISAVAVTAALSLFAGVQWGVASAWRHPSAWYDNSLVHWSRGELAGDMEPMGATFADRDIDRVTGPVIALYGNESYQNLKATFLAQTLVHRAGGMVGLYEVFNVKIGGPTQPEAVYLESLGHLKKAIAGCATPPTVLVGDRQTADRVRHDLADQGTPATVLYAPVSGG